MIKAIAVDDEPVALDIIRIHAAKVDFVDLKETFSSARQALDFLANEYIELVFLDINMPDMSGLELASLTPPGVQIIFTTAHALYAVAGFDMAITDFLLKPINYQRFLQACTLAQSRTNAQTQFDKNSFFVKDSYKWVKIDLLKLLYIKAEDNYLSLAEPGKQTLVRMTMQEIMKKLPSNFLRVHKSYIVNTMLIDDLESYKLSICGATIPVAKPFMEDLKKALAI
jgi:DNA-binding LytR/AlgR family response regulator